MHSVHTSSIQTSVTYVGSDGQIPLRNARASSLRDLPQKHMLIAAVVKVGGKDDEVEDTSLKAVEEGEAGAEVKVFDEAIGCLSLSADPSPHRVYCQS